VYIGPMGHAHGPGRAQTSRGDAADPVATLLGMSPAELTNQLQQGFSLSDVALSKGVSRTDLLGAVQARATRSGGGSAAAAVRTADTVGVAAPRVDTWEPAGTGPDAAAGATYGRGHHGHGGPGGVHGGGVQGGGATASPGAATPLDAAGALLGMNADELTVQMAQGYSMSDIAIYKGVDHGALVDAIAAALPATSGGAADAAAQAERIAATPGRARPGAAPPPTAPGSPAPVVAPDPTTPATPSTPATDPLAPAGDLLGMSVDDLNLQLEQGFTLNDVAISRGVAHEDLITALKAGMTDAQRNAPDATAVAEQLASTPGTPPPDPGAGG